VHAGHFASFGATRLHQLIAAYCTDKAAATGRPSAKTTAARTSPTTLSGA
jgi:hypothetical protein